MSSELVLPYSLGVLIDTLSSFLSLLILLTDQQECTCSCSRVLHSDHKIEEFPNLNPMSPAEECDTWVSNSKNGAKTGRGQTTGRSGACLKKFRSEHG